MLYTSGFVDNVVFLHNGQKWATGKSCVQTDLPGCHLAAVQGRSLMSTIALFKNAVDA